MSQCSWYLLQRKYYECRRGKRNKVILVKIIYMATRHFMAMEVLHEKYELQHKIIQVLHEKYEPLHKIIHTHHESFLQNCNLLFLVKIFHNLKSPYSPAKSKPNRTELWRYDRSLQLYTHLKQLWTKLSFRGPWSTVNQVYVIQNAPLPAI